MLDFGFLHDIKDHSNSFSEIDAFMNAFAPISRNYLLYYCT